MSHWIGRVGFVCAMAVLAACSQPHHRPMDPLTPAGPAALQRFAREMEAGMQTMMKDMHAPGFTGNPDVDFLAMMIPHHRGAVEMARLALIHGKDPLTRRVAEEIIASQTVEIAAMEQRLAILRRGDDPDSGNFPALHGTRGVAP